MWRRKISGVALRIGGRLCAMLLCALATPSPAQTQADGGDVSTLNGSDLLAPGQYVWAEGEPVRRAIADDDPPLWISVSLQQQRINVWRGDRLIGAAAVSTGAPGHETPVGEFTILQKAVFHRSNLYSGAPMPYMQRLTWDGIALHAGHNPGHPASHGCIRLPPAFARELYGLTRLGAAVVIDEFPGERFWLTLDGRIWDAAAWDDRVTGGGPHWIVAPALPYDLLALPDR